MRKQCIVAILAVLFSVMMASTAVPFGLPDLEEIAEEVPEIPDVVPEEVAELLDVVLEGVPELTEVVPELTEDLSDSSSKRTPSEIVRKIEKQGMELTDEHDILRIGTNGCVLTNITEETGYRWAIGNKSIELIEDGNRKISPEDLKKLIGEKGIVLEYTWQIGDEGIELIGENGTVPPGDLQEFMENHSFYLIGTTPINSTVEENEETEDLEETKELEETKQEKEIP